MTAGSAVVLVNRSAAGGRRIGEVRVLVRELLDRGWQVRVEAPSSVTAFADALTNVRAEAPDCIVIAGGDGTWHHAIDALAGSNIPVALLPVGTGDDNARTLGFPRRDPSRLAAIISSRGTRRIDLGRLTSADGHQEHFSGIVSVGFDSRVNARANDVERLPGTLRYLVAAVAELREFQPADYTVTHDGEVLTTTAMLIAVGNGRYYGGGMAICPGAQVDDGRLDLTILNQMPMPRFLTALPTVYRGAHIRRPEVRTLQAAQVTIEADEQPVFADGEPAGSTPVQLTCVPDALVIVTAQGHEHTG